FLAHSTYTLDVVELVCWKFTRSLWNMARCSQIAVSGLKRRHVWLDQHRITFLEGGRTDGETVVLLHGFGANKENWLFMAGVVVVTTWSSLVHLFSVLAIASTIRTIAC